MSTSDDTGLRISTEMVEKLIRRADVAELRAWDESPWAFDVGAQTVRDETFGKLRLPVVWEGEVIYGDHIVDAERVAPQDGGQICVLDLSAAGWSREKATAAALGEMTADRAATVDDTSLAELLVGLAGHDRELTDAAGWDGDDIDALLEQIEADAGDLNLNDAGGDTAGLGGGPVVCPNCGVPIDA